MYKISASNNATREFIKYIDLVYPQTMLRKAYWKNEEARYYNNIPPKETEGISISYKLTNSQIVEINDLCEKLTISQLSEKFKVSRTTIHRIINGKYIGYNK